MGVWIYSDADRDEGRVRRDADARSCIYCSERLRGLKDEVRQPNYDRHILVRNSVTVKCCAVCGWWTLRESYQKSTPLMHKHSNATRASCGVLRNLDVTDQSVPLAEIRRYLAVRYDTRAQIPPSRFEEVAVSVYKALGYDVEATGKTGDGGIDAVFRSSDGDVIGVQIKRYEGKIEAAQIREFVGSLYIKGILQGIYITTSSYTRGAQATAAAVSDRTQVELVDARHFYEQLRLAQRAMYVSRDDPDAPWNRAQTVYLDGYGWV